MSCLTNDVAIPSSFWCFLHNTSFLSLSFNLFMFQISLLFLRVTVFYLQHVVHANLMWLLIYLDLNLWFLLCLFYPCSVIWVFFIIFCNFLLFSSIYKHPFAILLLLLLLPQSLQHGLLPQSNINCYYYHLPSQFSQLIYVPCLSSLTSSIFLLFVMPSKYFLWTILHNLIFSDI